MVALYNSFNGGTDTATITTANSDDGDSGTTLDTVTITNATLTYTTNTRSGTGLAARAVATAGSASGYGIWSSITGAPYPALYTRMYINQVVRGTGSIYITRFLNTAGNATKGWLGLNSSGNVILTDSAFVVQTTSSTALTVNTWYRLETYLFASTTVGQIICRIYSTVEGLTPVETVDTGASINTNTVDDVGRAFVGLQLGSNTTELLYDDIAIVSDNWIGPVHPMDKLGREKFVNRQAVYRM
jgi:hypothetical protein